MTIPVRLQLSRRKGFDLQAISRATNGLEAVNVARPGKWGNPFDFRKSGFCWLALAYGCRGDRLGRQEASVRAFRAWVEGYEGKRIISIDEGVVVKCGRKKIDIGERSVVGEAPALQDLRQTLRNKNVACWCKPGEPCHADVLLDLANAPRTETDGPNNAR